MTTDAAAPADADGRWFARGAAFLLLSTAAILVSVSVADPDLWGHVRFGLDILRGGSIPQADPYSYTAVGQRWINHEWLAEVLFALAWTAAGSSGLVLLKAAVASLTLAALCAPAVTRRVPAIRIAVVFSLLCLPLFIPFFMQVRPQIFTYLLFAVLLLILRRGEAGAYRWLWAAPPLVALWANLHGGFLAGLGVLAVWGLAHLSTHWHARWKVFWPLLAAPAAALLNPYGAELLFFLAQTATVPRPEILDWQPLSLASAFGLAYGAVLATALAGFRFGGRPRSRSLLLLFALLALMPWLAVRHLPLFCIAAFAIAGEHAIAAWERLLAGRARGARPPAAAGLAALPVAAAFLLLALAHSREVFSRIHVTLPFPVAAVELLAGSGAGGRLAVDFGWGEYAIWHLAPRIQVGMDGRRETVYAEAVYQRYLDFHRGVRDWEAFLRHPPADLALVRRHTAIDNLLRLSPDWQAVFEDDTSALFVRRGARSAASLRAAADRFEPSATKRHFP